MADLGSNIASGAGAGAALGTVIPGVGNLIGGVGGGLIGVVGGIIGAIAGGQDRQKAFDALAKANDLVQELGLPPSQATPIILEQFKQAGIYDPKLLQQVEQVGTDFSKIAPDTSNINAQQEALKALQERGVVGLNAEDRLALQQIRNQVGADAEAKRRQILQNMQQMGQGGGGAALAAQLQAAQASANNESLQANQQAAIASQRALQAIQGAGNLSGDIRNQNFNVASQKASAQDQMNRFNVGNQMSVNQQNQQAENAGQLFNIQNAQGISNQNVSQTNNELLRQRSGQQQDFANKVNLTNVKADGLKNIANAYMDKAAATGQQIAGVSGGLANVAGGIGQYYNNQDNNALLQKKYADDKKQQDFMNSLFSKISSK
jgi:hypothetical protein